MRIAVIGLGYLGATHAACMAELGHEVLGIESDTDRLNALEKGEVPFYEPGLPELLRKQLDAGRIKVSNSYDEAVEWADVFFIAVGTPQKKGEFAADLQFVDSVIETLVPRLTRDTLLIGKSTVPVGTSSRLVDKIEAIAKDGVRVELVWNPEFLREGHAISDTLEPDRLVLGVGTTGNGEEKVREIYRPILEAGTPFLVMDTASAEMVKVAANSFLATKISFINAIAEVCEAAGADVTAVADAIGHDDRIGRKFLNAGLGFGGGCLPKDIRAFMARAGELGADQALTFLREVDSINMRRRTRMVELARRACSGSILGKRIAVLGTAFKPNSDDVRDSPALNIAGQLQLQGASVTTFDPRANESAKRLFPTLQYAETAIQAAERAELVMILTEWPEFVAMNPIELADVVDDRIVIDGRNCLPAGKWETAHWTVLR